jgi:hypothetical protein
LDSLPLIVFWVSAAYCLFSGPTAIVYLLFISMPFGAFAVVPPELSAGLTFTPTPMAALLLILRVFTSRRGFDFLISLMMKPTRLTALMIFWVVAFATTIFMPRLFARQVEVIPLRIDVISSAAFLEPTNQNISQLAYLSISVLTAIALSYVLRDAEARKHSIKAMCYGAIVVIITGMLDFATQFLPIAPLLEPFRTATYALLTDAEILGSKRVVGLTPEASSFGSLSLAFLSALYFFRRAIDSSALRSVIRIVLLMLVACIWLSTSSAAYVGLLIFGGVVTMEWFWRGAIITKNSRLRENMTLELLIAVTALFLVCAVTLYDASIWTPVVDTLTEIILNKSMTSSFEERGTWTATSLQAFIGTYGLGVGLGGTRASNSIVSLLSNVGLLGALFYYGFVANALLRKLPQNSEPEAIIIHAARWSFIAPFATSVLAGTSPDFGPFNAWIFGISLAGGYVAMSNRSKYAVRELVRL